MRLIALLKRHVVPHERVQQTGPATIGSTTMTIAVRRLSVASLFTLAAGFVSMSGLAQTGMAVGACLDGKLPNASPRTSPDAKYAQADFYPGLTVVEPLRIVEHPVEDRLVIVGKDGKAWSVAHTEGATDKKPFFDIGPNM